MQILPGPDSPDVRRSAATVPCPRCDSEMIATVREPLAAKLKVRIGSPSTPKVRLAVWRCITCGIESPRFS